MKTASVSPWPNVPATMMMFTSSQESLLASMMSTGEWEIQNYVKKNTKHWFQDNNLMFFNACIAF